MQMSPWFNPYSRSVVKCMNGVVCILCDTFLHNARVYHPRLFAWPQKKKKNKNKNKNKNNKKKKKPFLHNNVIM